MSLSSVVVSFIADIAKYTEGLTKMSKHTKDFGNQLKKDVSAAGDDLMKLGKWATAAGAAMYTGLAVGVLKSVEEMAKLRDEARKIGMSAESFQVFGAIAQDVGVETETLRKGFTELTKAINEVDDGNSKTIATFNELGISVEKFKNLKPEERMAAISTALNEITDENEKNRLGMELFGKQWADMKVVLDGGAEAMAAAAAEAGQLGKVMSEEDVIAVKELQKGFNDLKEFVSTAFNIIASSIAPILTAWINKFLDWLKEGNNLGITMQNILYGIMTPIYMVAKAVDALIAAFYYGKGALQLVAAGFSQLASWAISAFGVVADGWQQLLNLIIDGWNSLPFTKKLEKFAFADSIKELANDIQSTTEELAADAAESFDKAGDAWKNGFGEKVSGITAKLSTAVAGVTTRAQEAGKKASETISNIGKAAAGANTDYKAWYKTLEDMERIAARYNRTAKLEQEKEEIMDLILFQATFNMEFADSIELMERIDELNGQIWLAQHEWAKTGFEYMSQFADSMANVVVNGGSMRDVFKSLVKEIELMIVKTTILHIMMSAIGLVSSGGASAFGQMTGIIPKVAGKKASGGPVGANSAYLVGEMGPELFIPNTGGYVLPNAKLGGLGGSIVQNIYVETGVSQTVKAEMMSLLPQFKQQALSGVIDARRRGGALGVAA